MPEPTVDVDAVPRPDGPEKKYLDLASDSLTGSLDGPGLVRPRSSGRKSAGHRPRGPCARAMEPLYRPRSERFDLERRLGGTSQPLKALT